MTPIWGCIEDVGKPETPEESLAATREAVQQVLREERQAEEYRSLVMRIGGDALRDFLGGPQ